MAEKENTAQFALNSEFIGDVSGRAYGLGELPEIPSGDDANNYVNIGCWAVKNDANASRVANIPVPKAGRLIVSAPTGYVGGKSDTWVYREQLFLPHNMYYGDPGWIRMVAIRGSTEWEYGPWNSLALQAYPVNSIYISFSHTSPAELFGGKWERISNAFLWAVDSSGTIGQTGGEKTHVLTANEMPSHTHDITVAHEIAGSNTLTSGTPMYRNTGKTTDYVGKASTWGVGGGAAHNNMPPYIQVSIWRRTA